MLRRVRDSYPEVVEVEQLKEYCDVKSESEYSSGDYQDGFTGMSELTARLGRMSMSERTINSPSSMSCTSSVLSVNPNDACGTAGPVNHSVNHLIGTMGKEMPVFDSFDVDDVLANADIPQTGAPINFGGNNPQFDDLSNAAFSGNQGYVFAQGEENMPFLHEGSVPSISTILSPSSDNSSLSPQGSNTYDGSPSSNEGQYQSANPPYKVHPSHF